MKEILIDDYNYEDIVNDEFVNHFLNWDFFELKLLFKSDFKNSKIIRDILVLILAKFNITSIWKNRFIIIIDELVNNSIEHGSIEWDINKIIFVIRKEENKLIINLEVKDTWKKHNIKAVDMQALQTEKSKINFLKHDSIRWRWLFLIIKNLVDNIYFKDREEWWLTVWIEKIIETQPL